MLFLQLLAFALLLVVAYFIFNRELCHPSVLLCAVFLFSTACATCNVDAWGIDYRAETFLLLVGMMIVFVMVGCVCSMFARRSSFRIKKTCAIEEINLPVAVFATICIVDIACVVILFHDVYSIASRFCEEPLNSIGDILSSYKNATFYGNADKLSFLADKGRKFSNCCAYIFLIMLAFNLSKDSTNWRKWAHYCIPIFLGFAACFLNSGRLQMLLLVGAAVFCWLFIGNWRLNKKSVSYLKKIALIAGLLAVVLVAFYAIRLMVGRSTTVSWDLFGYITMYAGGSMELINLYLQDPTPKADIFGFETFYTLIANLYNYGFIDLPSLPTMQLEFRYYGSLNLGNVYTAYRRWISDFGIGGALLLQIVLSFVFHTAYYRLQDDNNLEKSFGFVLYVYLVPTLMMQSIDSVFFRTVFSFSFIFELIFLYLLYFVCIVAPLKQTRRSNLTTSILVNNRTR